MNLQTVIPDLSARYHLPTADFCGVSTTGREVARRGRSDGESVARSDLETLLKALNVDVVSLEKVDVAFGEPRDVSATNNSLILYCSSGQGLILLGSEQTIVLKPHTLVLVPPGRSMVVTKGDNAAAGSQLDSGRSQIDLDDTSPCVVEGRPGALRLILGTISAEYCSSISLFGHLTKPIVEEFQVIDAIEARLEAALAEMRLRDIGTDAMAAALIKQVVVTLLRRSMRSESSWRDRFALLSDPQISRAFASMVSRPGATHTVSSLSATAALGRSTFMARFQKAVGCSPMDFLRQLRMKISLDLIESRLFSIEQVAYKVGYASRSSFARAYRLTFGSDPVDRRKVGSHIGDPGSWRV